MGTSNLIFCNSQSNLITVKYCGLLSIFPAEYGGRGYINVGSTMDTTMYRWQVHGLNLQPLMTRCNNSHHHPWERETETKMFVTIDQGSNLMWTSSPLFGEIERVKKHPKITRNTLSNAILKSCCQNFAADRCMSSLTVLPKKPSKFTPAHDTVVAALSQQHQLIMHVDAAPIQLSNGSPLLFALDVIHHKFLFSTIFWRDYMCSTKYTYLYICWEVG